MNVIAHNMMAANANRQFNINVKKRAKSNEKLSSGYRINRSADDAAGLSISEKMRNQIRNLRQATDNIEDGISLIHTAEGVFNETHQILHRMEELSVQAANDTYSEDDRASIDAEIQQLKEEISDSFFRAQFNGKYLFCEPYLPEVWGTCDDYQLFNDFGATGVNGYGGISINNIRYTWQEMGVSFDSQGCFANNHVFKHTDAVTGEMIEFEFPKGSEPTDARRIYKWKAENGGISINGIPAVKWEDVNGLDPANPSPGVLSFDYRGMHIKFKSDAYSMNDLEHGINGKWFNTEVHWVGMYTTDFVEKAVDILHDAQSIRVTEGEHMDGRGIYKNDIQDVADFYTLYVDENGVQLRDKANHGHDHNTTGDKHTFIKWEDFHNGTTVKPNDSWKVETDYPIVDWGENNDNSIGTITFDHDAIYHYKDEYTGIEFDFRLADEASYEKVHAGMELSLGTIKTDMRYSTYTDSELMGFVDTLTNPITKKTLEDCFELKVNSSNISYENMLKTGRNFDVKNYDFLDEVTVNNKRDTLTNEVISYEYVYKMNNLPELKTTIDAAKLNEMMRKVEYGTQRLNIDLTADPELSINATYKVDNFQTIVSVNRNRKYGLEAVESADLERIGLTTYMKEMDVILEKVFDNDNISNTGIFTEDEKNILRDYMEDINDICKGDVLSKITEQKVYDKITISDQEGYTDTNQSINQSNKDGNIDYKQHLTDRRTYFTDANSQLNAIVDKIKDMQSIVSSKGVNPDLDELSSRFVDCIDYTNLVSGLYNDAKNNLEADEENELTYNEELTIYRRNVLPVFEKSELNMHTNSFVYVDVTNVNENAKDNFSIHSVYDYQYDNCPPKRQCIIQSGANATEDTTIEWQQMNLTRLGLGGARCTTREEAVSTIARVQKALHIVNENRSNFGAIENRLEYELNNNLNYGENLEASESNIRDTDMAKEMSENAKHNLLIQASQAMLTQANQTNQYVLNLLQK
ncbi:MAG: flagellin [Lachnospiraceae bacterium]